VRAPQLADRRIEPVPLLIKQVEVDLSFRLRRRTIVFDLPKGSAHLILVVTHGLFPDLFVIGSEQSFLHKPTIIDLQIGG
jgi:hypothetical protein